MPCHMDLSLGLLECPHDMAAGVPWKSDLAETKAEAAMFFIPLEAALCHFCNVLLVKQSALFKDEGPHRCMKTGS